MRSFRYSLDPLCLASTLLYAVNRWLLAPQVPGGFLTDQFNDLLLIPAALPIVLWLHRKLGLRPHDAPPGFREIALHLIVWSVLCEGIGPHLIPGTVGDWRDVAAYGAGAAVAAVWWQREHRFKPRRLATT